MFAATQQTIHQQQQPSVVSMDVGNWQQWAMTAQPRRTSLLDEEVDSKAERHMTVLHRRGSLLEDDDDDSSFLMIQRHMELDRKPSAF